MLFIRLWFCRPINAFSKLNLYLFFFFFFLEGNSLLVAAQCENDIKVLNPAKSPWRKSSADVLQLLFLEMGSRLSRNRRTGTAHCAAALQLYRWKGLCLLIFLLQTQFSHSSEEAESESVCYSPPERRVPDEAAIGSQRLEVEYFSISATSLWQVSCKQDFVLQQPYVPQVICTAACLVLQFGTFIKAVFSFPLTTSDSLGS